MDTPRAWEVYVRVLGVVVKILVGNAELSAEVRRVWASCLVGQPPPAAQPAAVVTMRTPEVAGPEAVGVRLRQLTQEVTTGAIRANTGSLLMFHAAALSNQDTGASIAFVAPGGTGKTTLVRTLGHGRGYVTDETVGVDRDGLIAPYPKPLSVRRPGAPHIKDEIPPAELALSLPRTAPWLAGIVVLRRDLRPGRPVKLERIDLLDALVTLAPETSSLAALHTPLKALADTVRSVGGVRVLHYHDAKDVEPIVQEALETAR
jgi:hypothetical protein